MSATELDIAGHRVGRVGYGAMQLATMEGLKVGPDTATGLLTAAVEAGVRHIDTAQFYGNGELNRLIGATVLKSVPELLVATKIGAVYDPATRLRPAQRPAELRAQVEANLDALGTDRLGLVYLRRTDSAPGIISTGDQVVDLDSQLAELVALRDEGKLGAIGLSSVGPAQLEQALPAGIAAVQNPHSLADRGGEPVLDVCRANDIPWVPYFPLGGNSPRLTKVTDLPAVRAAADRLGVTPAQLALAWHLHHYRRTALIPGTRDLEHLAANLATATLDLPPEALSSLDRP